MGEVAVLIFAGGSRGWVRDSGKGVAERRGGRNGIWVRIFLFFFFNSVNIIIFLMYKKKLPRGSHISTNVAVTSALNRSIDGKCNGCMKLK